MQQQHDRRTTYFGVAVMWFVGGSIYPFLSNVAEKVDPLNVILIRSIGAALILLVAVLIIDPTSFKKIKFDRTLIPIVVASMMFSPICSGALAWSSGRIPGALSALMYSTLPAMATIYLIVQKKSPSKKSIIGVLIASVAVVFLVGAPQGPVQTAGVLAALLSVFAWFAATEIWIKYETGYPLILAIFLQVAIGALGTVLVHLFLNPPAITAEQIFDPSMLFLIVALASQYWAYLGISRRVSPAVLTSFAFVNPVVAGAIGYFAFDQQVSAIQLIAGALLLSGVFLVVREDL
jgi:drug/metabolite transporter (DMT)-like permease